VHCYYGGSEIPSHRKLLAEQNISHVALSYMGLRRRIKFARPWSIAEHYGADQSVLLDSGCHTLNREGVTMSKEEIQEIADHYLEFVEENIDRVSCYTEFDALLMGGAWIADRRQCLHPEKGIVVWHEQDGVDALKKLAHVHQYIAVGQATCNDRDILPTLRGLAKDRRLHGMGFSSPPLLLAADWYSVSSTTWLSAAQHGETFLWTGTEMKRYPTRYKEQARKRHRVRIIDAGFDIDLIEADDASENLRLSLWSWQQQMEHITRRHGEGVTPSLKLVVSENAENDLATVTTLPSPAGKPAYRERVTLPGIETEDFTYTTTDDNGQRTTKTEQRVQAVDTGIRNCDGCFLSAKCPEFDPGSVCAYEIPIRVKTKEQYLALLDAYISMTAQRVFFMRIVEEAEGGYVDANLSKAIDQSAQLIKLRTEIEESGFSFTMKMQGNPEGSTGILSRLFGAQNTGGPPALSPAGAVSAETALHQMGVVYDAEVISEE
jgi:hypothetical protein